MREWWKEIILRIVKKLTIENFALKSALMKGFKHAEGKYYSPVINRK